MRENENVKVIYQHVVIVNGRGVKQLRVTFRKIEFYIDSAASCTRQWAVDLLQVSGPGRTRGARTCSGPACGCQLLADDSCHYHHHVGLSGSE